MADPTPTPPNPDDHDERDRTASPTERPTPPRAGELITAAVYEAEKLLKEHGGKISAEQQEKLPAAMERVREAVKKDDHDEMKSASEALTQAWHAVSSELYAQAGPKGRPEGAQGGPQGGPGAGQPGEEGPQQKKGGDDVIDADYEVVDDDKK